MIPINGGVVYPVPSLINSIRDTEFPSFNTESVSATTAVAVAVDAPRPAQVSFGVNMNSDTA